MKAVIKVVLLGWISVSILMAQEAEAPYNVEILVMDGVYNTEMTAPYDIFQHTKYREGIRPMRVFLVSEKGGEVHTFEGMTVKVDYSFETVPSIDILVVPAAEGHLEKDLENQVLLDFVQDVS